MGELATRVAGEGEGVLLVALPLPEGLDEESASGFADFSRRLRAAFTGLAGGLREARRAIEERDRLREENRQLRQALAECVEACGRFLPPAPDGDEEDEARLALRGARQLLERASPVALLP